MLLVMSGLETNPGPVSRMYLISKPLTPEPGPPLNIYCCDGGICGDFSIISAYSEKFTQLFEPTTCECYQNCGSCAPAVHLPDFSTITLANLVNLLTTGETQVTKTERKRVLQLQAALGCSGISRHEKVQLEPNQCGHCYRYSHNPSPPASTSTFHDPTTPAPATPASFLPVPSLFLY